MTLTSRFFYATLWINALAAGAEAQITNPIKANSFPELIRNIAGEIIPIAIPVAVVFLIYSGFLFVTAAGSQERLKTARATFTWTIVGVAIIIGARLIADVVINTVKTL